MQKTFTYPKFDFVRPPELADGKPGHYPVVVVGAGPAGLCFARALAGSGLQVGLTIAVLAGAGLLFALRWK